MATEVKKPTAFTDGSSVWSNEGQAYDTVTAGDETTYADSLMSGDFDPSLLLYTWQTKVVAEYTETILYVKWDCLLAQDDDVWGIQYTKNGGTNWYDLLASGNNSSAVIDTLQVTLDANQDLTQVQVKVTSVQNKGGDGHTVRNYDVWTEGEYTDAGTQYDDFITGELGSSGTVKRKVSYARDQSGDVVASGIISRAASLQRALAGDLEPSGIVSRVASLKRIASGTLNAAGTVVQQFAHEFVLSLSDYFTDGAATTFQLTAPATKSTTDFVAGKIHESSNPADSIDITTDDYTEVEFCIQATEYAKEVQYDFRIEGLDDYTVTPQWTVGGITARDLAGILPAMAGALQRIYKAKRDIGGAI